VVLYMKLGMSVDEAVREAVNDMRALQGSVLSQITVHAIDIKGHHKVIAINGDANSTYWLWTPEHEASTSLLAECITIR
jgi:beta-aspartyl-peptidase (threonine type)